MLRPWAGPAAGYPLDASEETGISRLEVFKLAESVLLEQGALKPGSLLPTKKIRLNLRGPGFEMPAPDPGFTAEVRNMVGKDAPAYGISVLDITDPKNPRYAEINGNRTQNPGSVGKIMVLLGWFQALADIYPDDIDARKQVLYETQVTANGFINRDSHVVPFWKRGDPKVIRRAIEIGDTANLWTWLDWMASASSNAAASQMISELVLLREFGASYPVSRAEADAFFKNTSKSKLAKKLSAAIQTPVTRNGLNVNHLRQGSLFTREGKSRLPGVSSTSTSSELLRYLVLMEEGKLVDPWSSLEIKKYLYLTDHRIRYGASPALDSSALYFKSGSLYSCRPEKGFTCGKYMGNKYNYLASTAIVETHGNNPPLRYIVVVLSNVLKKNSAEVHENFATDLHALIGRSH
ncbi:MAG: hypothetical protein JRG90_01890 [Deltaproteobacteria bacterium]|nr:hypothetical protein [Deltaproteobacteria bacterium]MBW2666421.1 hypothetical protein [Deltaproteobacteria bacterium]